MRSPHTKQTSQNSSNNFSRCTKDKNQTMNLKRRKSHPPRKSSPNININNKNQNKNRQIFHRKLIQYVLQHETVHISQREKPTKDQLHRQTCDK